jgi:hypothetical protein
MAESTQLRLRIGCYAAVCLEGDTKGKPPDKKIMDDLGFVILAIIFLSILFGGGSKKR